RMTSEFVDVVYRADIRVVQRRGSTRLRPQPAHRLLVVRQILRNEFERDVASEPQVLGAVDDTHPAAAKLGDDAIVRKRSAYHLVRLSTGSYHSKSSCR